LPAITQQSISLDELLGAPADLSRDQITARVHSFDSDLWMHARLVAEYVEAMTALLPGSTDSQRAQFVDAAWLHDIGKLTMAREMLLRPGPLTEAEWFEMRQHSTRGAEYLERSVALREIAPLVRQHHEGHDGSGYPNALRAEQIEFGARMIAVADAYDAMTSWRPYRSSLSDDAAVVELERCAGSQFDPEIVALFLRATESLRMKAAR
jgi:HD-GYP domain-containing protein (c-di-GMP phosphodiesterase class II)